MLSSWKPQLECIHKAGIFLIVPLIDFISCVFVWIDNLYLAREYFDKKFTFDEP